jgi:hypothetical protein
VDRFGPEGVEALSSETKRELDELLDLPSHLSEDELIRRARRIVDFEEELRRTRV